MPRRPSKLCFDDVAPALSHPAFTPDQVILIMDLPQLGESSCCPVEMPKAIEVLTEIADRLGVGDRVQVWREQLEAAAAEGLTPCASLYAQGNEAFISIEGIEVVPAAKA